MDEKEEGALSGDEESPASSASSPPIAPSRVSHEGYDVTRGVKTHITGKPLLCEQHSGEIIVLPELYGHATVNLQPSIGWASEFIFDRPYDDGLARTHGSEWWRTGERPAP